MEMKLLQQIHSPEDLRSLNNQQLEELTEEIRETIVDTVSRNGGHLASNLGAVARALIIVTMYIGRIGPLSMALLFTRRQTRDRVLLLIGSHGWPVTPERRLLKRRLNRLGEEALRQLIEVKRADALATGTKDPAVVEAHRAETLAALDALLAEQPCVTLRDMAVNGRDMMALGAKGRTVGETLQWLLEQVLDDKLSNDRDVLLCAAREHLALK